MMSRLSRQRCFNHFDREAAARCPECHRFFCRECVNAHDGRLLCLNCITVLHDRQPDGEPQVLVRHLRAALRLTAGFLVCWLLFYLLGGTLMRIPSKFHDTTLWHEK